MKVLDYLNDLAEKQIPVSGPDVVIHGFIKCMLDALFINMDEFIEKYGKPKRLADDPSKIDTEIDVIFKMKGQDDEWYQIAAYKHNYAMLF